MNQSSEGRKRARTEDEEEASGLPILMDTTCGMTATQSGTGRRGAPCEAGQLDRHRDAAHPAPIEDVIALEPHAQGAEGSGDEILRTVEAETVAADGPPQVLRQSTMKGRARKAPLNYKEMTEMADGLLARNEINGRSSPIAEPYSTSAYDTKKKAGQDTESAYQPRGPQQTKGLKLQPAERLELQQRTLGPTDRPAAGSQAGGQKYSGSKNVSVQEKLHVLCADFNRHKECPTRRGTCGTAGTRARRVPTDPRRVRPQIGASLQLNRQNQYTLTYQMLTSTTLPASRAIEASGHNTDVTGALLQGRYMADKTWTARYNPSVNIGLTP